MNTPVFSRRAHAIRAYPKASEERAFLGYSDVVRWTWNQIRAAYKYRYDAWIAAGSPEPVGLGEEVIASWKARVAAWRQGDLAAWKAEMCRWKALGSRGEKPAKPAMPFKPKLSIDKDQVFNRPDGEKPDLEMLKLQFNQLRATFAPWTSTKGHRDCWSQPFVDFAAAIQKWHAEKGVGFPHFKDYRDPPSFYVANDKFTVHGKHLFLPKMDKPVKLAEELRFSGKINGLRVTRDASGRWHAAISMSEVVLPAIVHGTEVIGIDLGVRTAVTYSTGESFTPPHERLSPEKKKSTQAKIRRVQRGLSRKYEARKVRRAAVEAAGDAVAVKALQRPSKNEKKQRAILNTIHARRHDQLTDWHHKLTTDAQRRVSPGSLGMETVSPKSWMTSKMGWAEKLSHAGLGELRRQYIYKCEPVLFPIAYPSSQLCSVCSHRQAMPLHVRVFTCEACGKILPRDTNAARRLMPTAENLAYIENMFLAQGMRSSPELNASPARRKVRETGGSSDGSPECGRTGFVPVTVKNANQQGEAHGLTC